jgi:hypothetical protein
MLWTAFEVPDAEKGYFPSLPGGSMQDAAHEHTRKYY